jgi:hypothetical protein
MSEPNSSLLLYQTEDGRTRIECRFENETVWLTQKLMAELFQKDVRTINEHIQNVFAEGELAPESVIRKFRITAADGKNYETQHYNLDVIIAVGYRVKSLRGTQFRQWATERLREYIVKGFTMDDERLKNPLGPGQRDYFDEQLERIRDIRSSERRFYQKVLDIYCSISTRQAWTTIRPPRHRRYFSPRCKTKCIGRRMVRRRPRSFMRGLTPSAR